MTHHTPSYQRGFTARQAMRELDSCPWLRQAADSFDYWECLEDSNAPGDGDGDVTSAHNQAICQWCAGWAAAERELFERVSR